MGKLRSRLSAHHADKEAGRRLADADLALHKALSVYQRVLKSGNRKEKRRAANAIDIIRKSMRVLGGVQFVGDRYDGTDPDLIPESEKVARSRTKTKSSERAE